MKLFERHSMLHQQVYVSTPFPEQSAEVSPMYNNIVIINGLMATLRQESVRNATSLPLALISSAKIWCEKSEVNRHTVT
jgi:hypothetical protein